MSYVRDVMKKHLITVEPDDSVKMAAGLMKKNRTHSILIPPPRGGRLWRIFTSTDLLLALESGEDPDTIPVAYYASPVVSTAQPDWTLEKAMEEMVNNGVKHLPVRDRNGDIIGIISDTDIADQYLG